MSKLARMSVAERRQMIDDFLAEVFVGINAAQSQRWGAARNLPDDPSPEQVDAWAELAELVSDPDFRQRMRQVMDIGRQIDAGDGQRSGLWRPSRPGARQDHVLRLAGLRWAGQQHD